MVHIYTSLQLGILSREQLVGALFLGVALSPCIDHNAGALPFTFTLTPFLKHLGAFVLGCFPASTNGQTCLKICAKLCAAWIPLD